MRTIGERNTTLDEMAGAEYANGMLEYATEAGASGAAIEYAAGLDSNRLGLAAAMAKSVVKTNYFDDKKYNHKNIWLIYAQHIFQTQNTYQLEHF